MDACGVGGDGGGSLLLTRNEWENREMSGKNLQFAICNLRLKNTLGICGLLR